MKLSTFLLLSGAVLHALAQDTTSSTLSIRSRVLPSGVPHTATSSVSFSLPITTGSQTSSLPLDTTVTGTPTIFSTTLPSTLITGPVLSSSTTLTSSTLSPTSPSSSTMPVPTSSSASSGAFSMKGLEDGDYVLRTFLASLVFLLN